ncbi:MAG: PilZ domain-containing protein [Desulfobacterales bacterium]|nr:PilZ domain-containing protein [Desulfobacterales bacterium]
MTGTERRQLPRYNLRARVEVRTAGAVIPADAVDIGVDGIHVVAPMPITPGTPATVVIFQACDAYVRGLVIWTLEIGRGGLPAYQIGIGADAIGMGEKSAVGHAGKTALIQSILGKIQEDAES